MAIASLILQLEPGKAEQVQTSLSSFSQLNIEKTTPTGELILVAEESSLTNLQQLCFDFTRKSTNSYASFPSLPMPYLPGNDEMCIKIPLLRNLCSSLAKY